MLTQRLFASAILIAAMGGAPRAGAASFSTLYKFANQSDGAQPSGNLVAQNGTLFGATLGSLELGQFNCSAPDCGTVYAFNTATSQLTTLHTFNQDKNGYFPAGLVMDRGRLIGITQYGGADNLGRFFAVYPATGAEYGLISVTMTDNEASIPFFYKGALYGTSVNGTATGQGPYGGIVYQYVPSRRTVKTLYGFTGQSGSSGLAYNPNETPVVVDGILYGTTGLGGSSIYGTIFKLDLATGILTTLYNFTNGTDGQQPGGNMVYDKGVLYGTSSFGGSAKGVCAPDICGAVWKFDVARSTFTPLYDLNGKFGSSPSSIVLVDDDLYVAASYDGPSNDGAIVAINKNTGRATLTHGFTGGDDGATPTALMTYQGAIYGTTRGYMPAGDYGSIFKIVP